MKKMICCGLAALLLLGAATAQAQISYGPKVGLNLSRASYKFVGDHPNTEVETDSRSMLGPSLGMMLNVRFGKLALQPTVAYSMQGIKRKDSFTTTSTPDGYLATDKTTYDTELKVSYLSVPVNLVYTTGGDHGFQVFAGPYVSFGLGGKVKTTEEYTFTFGGLVEEQKTTRHDSDVEFKAEVTDDDMEKEEDFNPHAFMRSLDFGLNVGAGYLIRNFQVQVGYSLGLSQLSPEFGFEDLDMGYSLKNRVAHFSVGYLFGHR